MDHTVDHAADHTGQAPRPAYPLPRPATGEDARSTAGLTLDVAAVLTGHGYPPLSGGADLLRLQQALFTLIYQENR